MMLKIDNGTMGRMEAQHPGIRESIRRREEETLPVCPRCGSAHTAGVGCGVVGRTIYIAAATTKFKLVPNLPKPGEYYCNDCNEFFS